MLVSLFSGVGACTVLHFPPTQIASMRSPIFRRRHGGVRSAGLGLVAISCVLVDYLRHISPAWHELLQPALYVALAIAVAIGCCSYKHWNLEFRYVVPFILSILFMFSAILFEMISVRSLTAVLGLDWHKGTPPLPDVGHWLLLALNEKLPQAAVDILRAPVVVLQHYLMLIAMLCFSVLFNSIEAPGLGLAARYVFTMGIGRLLRAIAFVSTILPSPRPWCASDRFQVPTHPHYWAQKYYIPYAKDSNAIRHVIKHDVAYAVTGGYLAEFQPKWGPMNFLADFLRPTASEGSFAWYHLLKGAGGGCNDLLYSGHVLLAALTAMAWTEAYGGYTSALIWLLVAHSLQREIRERQHYSVDCIVAIYVGVFLWKTVGLFWPINDSSRYSQLNKFKTNLSKLVQAAKESDMVKVKELLQQVDSQLRKCKKKLSKLLKAAKVSEMVKVRELLQQMGLSSQVDPQIPKSKAQWLFSGATTFFAVAVVVLAFILTSDG